MNVIRTVAVFCASAPGRDPAHRAAVEALGRGLAAAGITLVYGGGRVGLMGALADAAMEAGGRVVGVIPAFLVHWEVAHDRLSELIVTDTIHARKQRMFELADAFVSMPGGLGTVDETIELITWKQLRLHEKPVILCDVAGSAAALLALVQSASEAGYVRQRIEELFEIVDGVDALMARLINGSSASPRAS